MGAITTTINSVSVSVYEGSFELDDSINSPSTIMFKVRDDAGTSHFTKGQPISITDSVSGNQYTGFVTAAIEDRVSPQTLIKTDISGIDNTYLANKRTYDGPEFTSVPAGVIFCALLNVLSSEGVTAQYASDRDTTATDFNAGTLSSVIGASNLNDGDLELTLAGSIVTYNDPGVISGTDPAIKLVGTSTQGYNNNYVYRKIWSGSQAIASGDSLNYDIWIHPDSPQIMAGVDFVCTDGTTFRDSALAGTDGQGILPHPKNDLSGFADGQWYNRGFGVSGALIGKTISYVTVAFEGDTNGTYTAWFKNIQWKNGATVKSHFFDSTQNTLQTNTQVSDSGYSNVSCSVVSAYTSFSNFTTTHSIDAAKIVKSSMISWAAGIVGNPAGVTSDATFLVETSVDNGASWQTATNNAAIPNLTAGMNIAGRSLQYRQSITLGKDPTVANHFVESSITVNPSYSATKTDVITTYDTQVNFNTGTVTNAKTLASGAVTLNGFTRNYDDTDYSNQTLFGNAGPFQAILLKQFYLRQPTSGNDVRSRMDFVGNWQNFTAEVDFLFDANIQIGMEYRTTSWINGNNSFAYVAMVYSGNVQLGRGTNGGASTFTPISTAALSLVDQTWHRLKLVVNGTNHKVYVDDVQYINATDATYAATGNIGLRMFNGSGVTQSGYFDNFGVYANASGTWVSPAISLTAATNYGSSMVEWDATQIPDTTSVLAETTINGGSTWQTVTNGGSISGLTVGQALAGVNVQVRLTLTGNNATLQPIVGGVTVWVLGQFNASGNRISPALSLATITGRLGGSIVAWNSALPSGCTLGVDTRIDAGAWTDQTAQNGLAVAGLNGQPSPTFDSFDTNTSANYTSTFATGGAVATVAFDTTNSRLLLTGGTSALYINNLVASLSDLDMYIDMDESDNGGLVFHYIDGNNFYDVIARDGSSSGSPQSSLTLFRTLAGVRTQVVQATGLTWPRNSQHRIRSTMLGAVITVYFDGTQKLTFTDGTPVGAGKCGLRNDAATKISRYYQLNIQPQGDVVSSHTIQSRLRLASTNPLFTPQVADLSLAAFGNTIQAGATIPQTQMFHKYCDANINDLAKASNFWAYFDKNKVAYFLARAGTPAPWIASSTPGWIDSTGTLQATFLDAGITVEDSSDLYRNRQIIDNVLAPVTINENRIGDGVSTSWTFGNEWAGAPTITVNGVTATVGVKNVDTGKQFYYAVGDNTITEDSNGPLYDTSFTLNFQGPGQYLTYSQYDNTTEQTALAAIEGTSGIVVNVEDGTGLTKAQGDALALARVTQYGVRGRLLRATTRRVGLAPGQLLPVFLPEHGINDGLFLVRQVLTHLSTEFGVQQGIYTIEAISGADVGDWTKLYQRA